MNLIHWVKYNYIFFILTETYDTKIHFYCTINYFQMEVLHTDIDRAGSPVGSHTHRHTELHAQSSLLLLHGRANGRGKGGAHLRDGGLQRKKNKKQKTERVSTWLLNLSASSSRLWFVRALLTAFEIRSLILLLRAGGLSRGR